MGSMMTRYYQFLCVIGLTLMMGCTDCSTTATSIPDATASVESPVSNATVPAEPTVPISIPEAPTAPPTSPTPPTTPTPPTPNQSCGDGTNGGGGVWAGDVTTAAELLAAKYCSDIQGSVLLENSSNITGIDFPVLERITGSFSLIDIYSLLSISMPVLATVHDLTIKNSNALMSLSLPKLATVTAVWASQACTIENNDALMSISMPRLTTIEGYVNIKENGVLTTISFPWLVTSSDIIMENLPGLTEIEFPVLERINGEFRLIESDAFVNLSLPVLALVRSTIDFDSNDALTSISMPVLTSVDYAFAIQGNPCFVVHNHNITKDRSRIYIIRSRGDKNRQ